MKNLLLIYTKLLNIFQKKVNGYQKDLITDSNLFN